MKIKKLQLHNFGVYAGDNEFVFEGSKPIVLIGGMNGRGKTTFLEAVLLALYGSSSFAYSERGQKTYSEYKQVLPNELMMQIENIPFNNLYLDLSKLDLNIQLNDKETLRDINGKILNIIGNNFHNTIGISSDNVVSTKAYLEGMEDISSKNYNGRNIRIGLRENLMGAVLNGLALSGFRPFASTYLASADYMSASIRNSALMNLPVLFFIGIIYFFLCFFFYSIKFRKQCSTFINILFSFK